MSDKVNHPAHYTSHPSGVECIQITEHMNFNLGNAIKYIWRADAKVNPIEDLEKARWYLDRESKRRAALVEACVPLETPVQCGALTGTLTGTPIPAPRFKPYPSQTASAAAEKVEPQEWEAA